MCCTVHDRPDGWKVDGKLRWRGWDSRLATSPGRSVSKPISASASSEKVHCGKLAFEYMMRVVINGSLLFNDPTTSDVIMSEFVTLNQPVVLTVTPD